jgi:hypothetical protein
MFTVCSYKEVCNRFEIEDLQYSQITGDEQDHPNGCIEVKRTNQVMEKQEWTRRSTGKERCGFA